MEVGCRLVARDFKGKDEGRDVLFAATPSLEAKRMLLSRAATNTAGSPRKLLFIDAKKAYLNPRCEQDVCGITGGSWLWSWHLWKTELLALWFLDGRSSMGEVVSRKAYGVWF